MAVYLSLSIYGDKDQQYSHTAIRVGLILRFVLCALHITVVGWIIVVILEAVGLTVPKPPEIMLLPTPHQAPQGESLVLEAAYQRSTRGTPTTSRFIYLDGVVGKSANISP